jgi:hypothetical protein
MLALDNFVRDYDGRRDVSFDGRPENKGQCVQAVAFYVRDYIKKPVIWADAVDWWNKATNYPNDYEQIENAGSATPQPGDIIIWSGSLPNSGGAGHIAECVQAFPGTGTFQSFDSNWGGKYCHRVTHNYDYVIGWLRPRFASPAPAAAPAGGTIEMIANQEQAEAGYKVLRPNGGGSPEEISGAAGKRSWWDFVRDAMPEVAARDANLRAQAQQLADSSVLINQQNAVIAELQSKVANGEQMNRQQVEEALGKAADANAKLAILHNQMKVLQDTLAAKPTAQFPAPSKPKANWAVADQCPSRYHQMENQAIDQLGPRLVLALIIVVLLVLIYNRSK